ncbi:MFS transporter [Bacillus sp. SA1-12]|uniref:MFS transporter n=1 Tax=Bacillus sp. SA1-12 TaxID=1455638 RepID=UPI0006273271|nr:MFS transporter [Bacillus sp. SA1-12]KKI90396.1 MFS transporter [Bacillus sp. SA1-12]
MEDYSKQIFFLKGLNFLHLGGKAVILPFLPLYLLHKGFSSIEIGSIMGVAPLISVIAQPMVSFISDKYKKVKIILVYLYLIVTAVSFGVFFSNSFWVVFISFLLFHFALSPCTPLIDSMSLKTLSSNKGNYGKIRLWGSLGFFSIALISSPLLQRIGIDLLFIPFFVTSIITLFALSFLKDQDAPTAQVKLKSVGEVIKNRLFISFLLLCLLVLVPHRINDTMIVLHLESLGATTFWIGLAWSLAALSEVPVFYFLARKVSDYDELFLLSIVSGLYTIRWILYGVVSSPYIATFLQVTQGITFGLFWLIAMQMAVRIIPDHLRSTGQAVLSSVCFGIGGAIGGTGGGLVLDLYGSQFLYQLMAAMTFVATILIFLFYRSRQLKSQGNHVHKKSWVNH